MDPQQLRTILHLLLCLTVALEKCKKLLVGAGQSGRTDRCSSMSQMGLAGIYDRLCCPIHEIISAAAMCMDINKSRTYILSFGINTGICVRRLSSSYLPDLPILNYQISPLQHTVRRNDRAIRNYCLHTITLPVFLIAASTWQH